MVNDFLEKSQKELEKVLENIKYTPKDFNVHRARFMRELTLNLTKAAYRKKHKKEIDKLKIKKELEQKKQELLRLLEKRQQPQPLQQPQAMPLPPPPPPPGKGPSTPPGNPLQEQIQDPNVKDITITVDKEISINYINNESKTVPAMNKEQMNDLIKDLAKQTHQELSKEKPFLATEINNKKVQANLGTEFMAPRLTIIRIE